MKIMLPGDKISDKTLRMENAIIENGKTYTTVIGLFDETKETFIPLETVWYPREGDFVIGIVEAARNSVYTLNFDSPFKGLIIPRRGFRDREENPEDTMQMGDVASAVVREVKRESDQIIMILDRPRKLFGGRLHEVRPSKIPRIIGKSNTMIKQLEEGTQCQIFVGLNGLIWLKGGDVSLAIKAIDKIQAEAHMSGLTERIGEMLAKERK